MMAVASMRVAVATGTTEPIAPSRVARLGRRAFHLRRLESLPIPFSFDSTDGSERN